MRRAVPFLASLLFASLVLIPRAAQAQKPAGIVNAIGIIDYGNAPDVKVGSWVKYRVQAHNDTSVVADYTMTVLIAGEEHWWGEDCFWIETDTANPDGSSTAVASLMSYDVFRDSLAYRHMQYYIRKVIQEKDARGNPVEQVYKRPTSSLHLREAPASAFGLAVDTIGTERIHIDLGDFDCRKVKFFEGRGQTGGASDSSDYTEFSETRITYMSPKVPITHIAREDIGQKMTRKAWKVGKSKDATPTVTLGETQAVATLVGFGDDGKSLVLPPSRAGKTLAASRAERKTVAPATTRARTAPRKRG